MAVLVVESKNDEELMEELAIDEGLSTITGELVSLSLSQIEFDSRESSRGAESFSMVECDEVEHEDME